MSTSGSFCMAGAVLGAPSSRSADVRRRVMLLGAASFCVAGAALGAPQVRFPWQAQHLEHLHRGPRKSGDEWCFWAPSRLAWQAQHLEHLRFVLRGKHSTWGVWRRVMLLGAALFCVAGAALGAPQVRFAWQAQHLGHLRFVLRGRRSTWSTFIEVRGRPAKSDAFGRCLVLRGRRSTWSTSGTFFAAGAALEHLRFVLRGRRSTLGGPQVRFTWQAQHLEHLHRGPRKSGDEWCFWAPSRFVWQVQHLENLGFVLRGRCTQIGNYMNATLLCFVRSRTCTLFARWIYCREKSLAPSCKTGSRGSQWDFRKRQTFTSQAR